MSCTCEYCGIEIKFKRNLAGHQQTIKCKEYQKEKKKEQIEINKLIEQNKELKDENRELKDENRELKTENREVKDENRELKTELKQTIKELKEYQGKQLE